VIEWERRLPGRCYLCGEPTEAVYCVAHAWALAPPVPVQLTLSDLQTYWLRHYEEVEIVELAAEVRP